MGSCAACCQKCKPAECKRRCCSSDRSFVLSFVPLLLTMAMWPLFGVFKTLAFPEPYPYPMSIGLFSQFLVFVIGTIIYTFQCFKRGFKCCGKVKVGNKKNPVTPMICFKRFFHWAFFPALFLDIFLYASYSVNDICPPNPNLCTVFFRSALFLFALVFLAIAKAGRRGGRTDWLVGVLLLIGVSLLLWNSSVMLKIEGQEDLQIILAGALVMVSFGAFPMMLRKATLNSGIKKNLWVMSFYSMLGLMPLAFFFEGLGAANDLTLDNSWKVLILILGCLVWSWSMVAAVAYSETICVALALHIGLVLGDLGVYSYISDGYTFDIISAIGFICVAIAFLWLLKRMLTLGFHSDMDKPVEIDIELGETEIALDMNEGSRLVPSSSKYGAVSSPMPAQKSVKQKNSRPMSIDLSEEPSGSFSESGAGSGKKSKKKRLSGIFKKKDKKDKKGPK